MDLKEIKKIISLVEDAKISSLTLENQGFKIEIKKEIAGNVIMMPDKSQQIMQPVAQNLSVAKEESLKNTPVEPVKDENIIAIKSPMVGTFYLKPNPDAEPYVKPGDKISSGQVVCIIEAMKIFNEIETEYSGIVEKICITNGSPVEYGQELFYIRIQ